MHELVDRGERPRAEPELFGAGEPGPERDVGADGGALDDIEGGLADAAGGGVDDAEQRDGVVGVRDDAEVGDGVLDFFALEEGGAACDLVGDAVLAHGVFHHA